jgi:cell division protease FtsH
VFLGYSMNRQRQMSDETAKAIDKEIRRIVDGGYERAREVLTTHEDQLHTLAKALLEYETLSGDEIKTVLEGGPIDRGTSTRPVVPAAGVGIPKTRRAGGIGGAAPAGA